jgi:hypothetical protein
MGNGDPYTIQETYKKTMKKKFICAVPRDHISADDKYGKPEKGFGPGRDPVNRGNGHRKSK